VITLPPPPVVDRVGRFYVVRDDMLAGGTKLRFLLPFLHGRNEGEIVYASPAQGYAQIALAHACKQLGKRAVIVVAKRKTQHPRTLAARAAGAIVILVDHGRLNVLQARARQICEDRGSYLLPFGADVPEAIDHLAASARSLNISPAEVWACSGSGVLIRGLQQAWPAASFNAVRVGAEPNIGRARLYVAPEKYEDPAEMPPPYPSCDNYDAKVWRFANKHGSDGALIWNVGA
jgi:hypothetical protein